MPTLKARIGGAWVPVGGGSSASEVEINASDPIGTNPSAELWYDTDAPTVMDNDMRWYAAWGVITQASKTTSSATVSSATYIDTGISVSYSQVAGRRYTITVEGLGVVSNVGGNLGVTITDAANAGISAVAAVTPAAAGAGTQVFLVGTVDAVTSGSVTYKARHNIALAGTGYMYADSGTPIRMIVHDVGPISGSVPVAPPDFDARWNTSWGIVAVAPIYAAGVVVPATTLTRVSNILSVYLQVGRRYRIVFNARAIQSNAPANSDSPMQFLLYDNGSNQGLFDYWHMAPAGNYDDCRAEAIFVGDGRAHDFDVRAGQNTYQVSVWSDMASHGFYIEDMGPVSGATAVPNPTPAWLPVTTFLNGWSNLGGGWQPVAYRKVGDRVELRGLAKRSTALTAGTPSSMFTLPTGYRAALSEILSANCAGATGWGDAQVRIEVQTGGDIAVLCGNATTQVPQTYTSLSGLSFSVTA